MLKYIRTIFTRTDIHT